MDSSLESLDPTAGTAAKVDARRAMPDAAARGRGRFTRRSLAFRLRQIWRAVVSRFSSALTRRIILLNLGGLVALLLGFLYLNQFRQGLIEARVQSLQTQSEIIAAAIAASATVDTDAITIDPEKLLKLTPGESYGADEGAAPALEFSINPDKVGPLLRRTRFADPQPGPHL